MVTVLIVVFCCWLTFWPLYWAVKKRRPVNRRAPAPELNPKWRPGVDAFEPACKHPDDQLLDIRSDAFTKGGLVATLCQACDEQLGPEIYQALMDRKFADWQHEIASKDEQEAERKRIADDLRAEQESLRRLRVDQLQLFLADGKKTLAGLRWGHDEKTNAVRVELSANCKKWREELERRGIKETPSWRRNLQDKLNQTHERKFSAGGVVDAYVPVQPDLRRLTQMYELGLVSKELILERIELERQNAHLIAERAIQTSFAEAVLRPQVEAIQIRVHGKAQPIRTTTEETYKEHWGLSDWLAANWKQDHRNTSHDRGRITVEMRHPELGFRILNFHGQIDFRNWASR
jgi:hypothetical protein